MRVTEAVNYRQPRKNHPEPCDHHTGLAIEANPDHKSMIWCDDVKLYNIFLPGIGTESFHLCPVGADELRRDS